MNMLVVVLNAGVYLLAIFTQLQGSHVERYQCITIS